MSYFPIFTELKGRPVLVVGAGVVAHRKITALLKAEAQVTVVSLEADPAIQTLADEGRIELQLRAFDCEDVNGRFLVIAATDDLDLNTLVYQAANSQQTWVNVVDDRKRSSFIVPSIVDRAPVTIAISSGGAAPVLVKQLREQLETMLPQSLGALATLADKFRGKIKQVLPSVEQRRRFWEGVFRGPVAKLVAGNRLDEADAMLASQVHNAETKQGWVSIVGVGPSDAELLTLKALRAMQQADVILYDRLVSDDIMALVRRDATLVPVGKCAGYHSVPQQDINQHLVDYAKQGLNVVRLKGGDPFIFGRGGEEAQTLAQEGIGFDVVPGITAAAGCAAYSGIPLTHRDYAQGVTFVTGHCKKDGTEPDWSSLAKSNQTLVVYMGLAQSAHISASLIASGKPASTPVAIIERGGSPNQRVIKTDLARMSTTIDEQSVSSPALLVIGDVVSLADTLHWYGDVPLDAQSRISKPLASVSVSAR